ncbi:hypothetical protein Zmor_012905 [Zophobas morio]|uniref:Uncharacterized protein n=1 Tax=Zophobas morio TaxID=2755281 RepID=A0AA38IGE0_9CUCU|nr:hypothetical protein Zmor_012905 [Zophobas morio]
MILTPIAATGRPQRNPFDVPSRPMRQIPLPFPSRHKQPDTASHRPSRPLNNLQSNPVFTFITALMPIMDKLAKSSRIKRLASPNKPIMPWTLGGQGNDQWTFLHIYTDRP